jgi:large subunit ribosomal protein L9
MEVILNKDVEKIGNAGQVLKVKDGFARNFLIPKGLAIPASAANLKRLEIEKQKRALGLEKLKQGCEELKEKLTNLSLTIAVLTQEDEKLYGSVGPQDIVDALNEEGFQISKDSVELEETIKALGIYEIPIKLHPEVIAKVKVWVVRK